MIKGKSLREQLEEKKPEPKPEVKVIPMFSNQDNTYNQFLRTVPAIPCKSWHRMLTAEQIRKYHLLIMEGYELDEGRCNMHNAVVLTRKDKGVTFRFTGQTTEYPIQPIKTSHYTNLD